MYWYVGPWQRVFDPIDGWCWDRPANTIGVFDLRSNPQCGTIEGTPGLGIFLTAEPIADSSYELLGSGSWADVKRSQRLVNLLPWRAGFSPAGDDLRALLVSLLTAGADPEGLERTRPAMPGGDGRVNLQIGPWKCRIQNWDHFELVRKALQLDFRMWWGEAQAGLCPPDHPLRALDFATRRLGLAEHWQLFVPADLLPHVPGPLPHATDWPDDFNRGNSIGLGANWTAFVQSGFDVEAQQARGTSGTALATRVRYNSPISSPDQFVQLVVHQYGVAGAAVSGLLRLAAAADTWLSFNVRTGTSPRRRTQKLTTGTSSVLASDDVAPPATPFLIATTIVGTTVRAWLDGVEIPGLSATETGLTGNLY